MTSEEPAQPAPPPSRPVFTVEQLSSFAPGLGTLMPEIGTRTWKLYYAAEARNWPLARFELGEIRGLMMRGATTRPRYEKDLKDYVEGSLQTLRTAIENKDFDAFDSAFKDAVRLANEYHVTTDHPFIVWKLPAAPPPDLDLAPQE
jgi:hypothetical protein